MTPRQQVLARAYLEGRPHVHWNAGQHLARVYSESGGSLPHASSRSGRFGSEHCCSSSKLRRRLAQSAVTPPPRMVRHSPIGPGGPCGPGGPVGPAGPAGPCGPAGPGTPGMPAGPGSPSGSCPVAQLATVPANAPQEMAAAATARRSPFIFSPRSRHGLAARSARPVRRALACRVGPAGQRGRWGLVRPVDLAHPQGLAVLPGRRGQ